MALNERLAREALYQHYYIDDFGTIRPRFAGRAMLRAEGEAIDFLLANLDKNYVFCSEPVRYSYAGRPTPRPIAPEAVSAAPGSCRRGPTDWGAVGARVRSIAAAETAEQRAVEARAREAALGGERAGAVADRESSTRDAFASLTDPAAAFVSFVTKAFIWFFKMTVFFGVVWLSLAIGAEARDTPAVMIGGQLTPLLGYTINAALVSAWAAWFILIGARWLYRMFHEMKEMLT